MRKNRTRILCGAAALVALIVIVIVGSVVIGTSHDAPHPATHGSPPMSDTAPFCAIDPGFMLGPISTDGGSFDPGFTPSTPPSPSATVVGGFDRGFLVPAPACGTPTMDLR